MVIYTPPRGMKADVSIALTRAILFLPPSPLVIDHGIMVGNIAAKLCPTDTEHTKANFNECIRDYLEAVSGLPNVGDPLILWLCTAKKPALMLMHEFIGIK